MKTTFNFIIILILLAFCLLQLTCTSRRNFDKLIVKLNDSIPSSRLDAVKKLGQTKDARAVEPLISALINFDMSDLVYSDTLYRSYTIKSLSDIGAPSVDPLILALKNENYQVRADASKALGEINDSRAVEPLIAALNDRETYVRSNAALSLGKIKDLRSVRPLIEAFRDRNADVCNSSGQALQNIGRPAVDTLISFLDNPSGEVRCNTLFVLGDMKDTSIIEHLFLALKDEDRFVRSGAAFALGKLNDKRAVEPLIQALKDEEIQSSAAEALGMLKDPRAIEPLISILKEKKALHDTPVSALIEIGSPAVQALTLADSKIVDDETFPYFSMNIAYVLSCINDTPSSEYLFTSLKNEKLETVAGAYSFFIRKGKPQTEGTLIKALDKYGDKDMAEVFLNCGNMQLKEAAEVWAKKNHYEIISKTGEGTLNWGNAN